MICNKCGSEIPDGSKFCVDCGAKVEEVVETPVAEEAVVEEGIVEETVTEETVAEKPAAEEAPVEENPVTEEPIAEEPVPVETATAKAPGEDKTVTPAEMVEKVKGNRNLLIGICAGAGVFVVLVIVLICLLVGGSSATPFSDIEGGMDVKEVEDKFGDDARDKDGYYLVKDFSYKGLEGDLRIEYNSDDEVTEASWTCDEDVEEDDIESIIDAFTDEFDDPKDDEEYDDIISYQWEDEDDNQYYVAVNDGEEIGIHVSYDD